MKKIVLTFLSIALMSYGYSQNNSDKTTSTNYHSIIGGFNIGLNQSALYNSNEKDEIQIRNAPGFRMGVFIEFPLSKNWSISPKAELSFNNGKVIDVTNDNVYKVDPYNIDFMVHFKHRFTTYNKKIQPYCNFGPNLRTPITREYDGFWPAYDTKIALAADFGFGFEIDVKHFYISPELRFSAGLTDIRNNPSGKTLRGSNAVLVLNFSGK